MLRSELNRVLWLWTDDNTVAWSSKCSCVRLLIALYIGGGCWEGDPVNSVQSHAIDRSHSVNIAKQLAIDRVTLSISQNCTLLTGSPCQQCIINRENVNQSEVRHNAANRSISYTCCLLSFGNTWVIVFPSSIYGAQSACCILIFM